MLKRRALMESISSNLHGFLKRIGNNLSVPDKKFLRDGLVGLLRCGQPIVCQMARHVPNQRTTFLSRLDRLEAHLVKDSDLDDKLKNALPEVWLPFVREDTPIILDLSDMAKPFAKKMDYLSTIRDGSTGALVNGYWLVELYASLSRKNPVPVLLEPFSHEEPYSPGQNPVVLAAVHKIFELTHKRGVLVVDRGFDGWVMFEDWLDNRYRFVARLVGERHLLRFSGGSEPSEVGQWVPMRVRQLAEQVPTPYRFDKLIQRRGKPAIRITQIGWMKVRLPGREEVLTLVVSRLAGQDKPMMLLTNVPVENLKDAKRILRFYIRRWECEEAIRFLKSQVQLEKIRTFRWSAIRRLALLAVVVMIYLGDNFDDVNNGTGDTFRGNTTSTTFLAGFPGSPYPDGLTPGTTYYWRIDEVNEAEPNSPWKGDIWRFSTPGAAGSLQPANGAGGVQINSTLNWIPATMAASHDVYFGTDKDAVKNATTASPEYKGNRPRGSENYDPGKLAWHSDYYWRVDAVYNTGAVKGLVWSFTTADFLLVDDFESYNDIDPPDPKSNRIFDKWIDGFGTTTNGAVVGNSLPPYAERTIIRGGVQAMPLAYDNNLKTSEATLTLIWPRDWTEEGVTRLSLWFRGDAANAPERMYVALNGTTVVYNNGTSLTQKTGWTEWVIPLQTFADQGVNLKNVNTITIGLGTKNGPAAGGTGKMYFDDIRLIRP